MHSKYDQVDEGATTLSSGTVFLYTNKTNVDRSQLTLNHKWNLQDNFSIEQTIRNANYTRNYKVNDRDGSTSTEDATKEKNNEYELLFNRSFEKLAYNGGLEFSKPEYKSNRITGGAQQKEIFGFLIKLRGIFSSINVISGLRLDSYGDTTVISPRLALSYNKMITGFIVLHMAMVLEPLRLWNP